MSVSSGTACQSRMLTVRCGSSPTPPRCNYTVHFVAFYKEVASQPLSSARHLSRSSPNGNAEPRKHFLPLWEDPWKHHPSLYTKASSAFSSVCALLTEEIGPESQKLIHLTCTPLGIVGLSTSLPSPRSNVAHAHGHHSSYD